MARVPDFKRISKEDFPSEYRELIEKLAFPINSHIEQVRNALNGNLDFINLAQEVKIIEFITGSDGQPINQVNFRSALNNNVRGMFVVRVQILSDNSEIASTLPVVSFSQNADIVNIIGIGGLLPETRYQLTLLTL